MFSGFKRDKEDVDKFKADELERLIKEYRETPEHHIKSKNDILLGIVLLEGDLETFNNAKVIDKLHDMKIDLIDIKRKMSELLHKEK